MLFSWQEKQECRFCGEVLERYSSRCPYCGSLQKKRDDFKKPKTKKKVYEQVSNGRKVFLSVISSIIPGIGQLIGAITGLVYMDSEHEDTRSFGNALFIASLLLFVISSVFLYLLVLILAGPY